ncbi:MAG: hypothetical protein EP298_03805 [Gammaproteobacteria bacterium]|nr:MAG: hypothetical protein EP298_03805 [Gammaproteobacteria bacterium]UTW43755.1 hypothetical protein KFE69_06610 [bacterium SCSIO 12844]
MINKLITIAGLTLVASSAAFCQIQNTSSNNLSLSQGTATQVDTLAIVCPASIKINKGLENSVEGDRSIEVNAKYLLQPGKTQEQCSLDLRAIKSMSIGPNFKTIELATFTLFSDGVITNEKTSYKVGDKLGLFYMDVYKNDKLEPLSVKQLEVVSHKVLFVDNSSPATEYN